jgi:hypothetical protein
VVQVEHTTALHQRCRLAGDVWRDEVQRADLIVGAKNTPACSFPFIKFMGGEPTKPATNKLAGSLYIFSGVSIC